MKSAPSKTSGQPEDHGTPKGPAPEKSRVRPKYRRGSTFALWLYQERKRRGLSLRQVELCTGISNTYYSQLENGMSPGIGLTIGAIMKISAGLNMDFHELCERASK